MQRKKEPATKESPEQAPATATSDTAARHANSARLLFKETCATSANETGQVNTATVLSRIHGTQLRLLCCRIPHPTGYPRRTMPKVQTRILRTLLQKLPRLYKTRPHRHLPRQRVARNQHIRSQTHAQLKETPARTNLIAPRTIAKEPAQ